MPLFVLREVQSVATRPTLMVATIHFGSIREAGGSRSPTSLVQHVLRNAPSFGMESVYSTKIGGLSLRALNNPEFSQYIMKQEGITAIFCYVSDPESKQNKCPCAWCPCSSPRIKLHYS